MGRYMLPSGDLGNGLQSQCIVLNLNLKKCFDFQYEPEKGDMLKINLNYHLSPYLSFVYKNEGWTCDHHDPWSIKLSVHKEGIAVPEI